MGASAVMSACGRYRYQLTRQIPPELDGPTFYRCVFVMLNPSTADGTEDDPTIRRCMRFAARLGATELTVVNLFAFRATDPAEMHRADNPVGPDNDFHIECVLNGVTCGRGVVVCAWGANGTPARAAEVLRLIRERHITPHALGLTKDGHPRHPLYLRADAPLVELPGAP